MPIDQYDPNYIPPSFGSPVPQIGSTMDKATMIKNFIMRQAPHIANFSFGPDTNLLTNMGPDLQTTPGQDILNSPIKNGVGDVGQSVPNTAGIKGTDSPTKNPISSMVNNYLVNKNSPNLNNPDPTQKNNYSKPLVGIQRLISNIGGTISGQGVGQIEPFLQEQRQNHQQDEMLDPASDISKQYQDMAKQVFPDKDWSGFSAAVLDKHMAPFIGMQQRIRPEDSQMRIDANKANLSRQNSIALIPLHLQARMQYAENHGVPLDDTEQRRILASGNALHQVNQMQALMSQTDPGRMEQIKLWLDNQVGDPPPEVTAYGNYAATLADEQALLAKGANASQQEIDSIRKSGPSLFKSAMANAGTFGALKDQINNDSERFAQILDQAHRINGRAAINNSISNAGASPLGPILSGQSPGTSMGASSPVSTPSQGQNASSSNGVKFQFSDGSTHILTDPKQIAAARSSKTIKEIP